MFDFEDAHEFARDEELVGRDGPRFGFGPKRDRAFCKDSFHKARFEVSLSESNLVSSITMIPHSYQVVNL